MSYRDLFMQENAEAMEKFLLAQDRIRDIVNEKSVPEKYQDFFKETADFILYLCKILKISEFDGIRNLELNELEEINNRLYRDIKIENYEKSYGNPEYMDELFGGEYGKYLCYLFVKIRSIIPYAITYR
ncbi:MAG: leucyl aminopeptidase, partial [Lachnospiraceae bacterium]|nr:leucyl aminopeptidase [Lachnospiraceae bacterium]